MFSTTELVKTAIDLGITSLALTNINTTYDTWDFVKQCQEANIKPITGAEIRNGGTLLYILIAANNRGLMAIHEFLSDHNLAKKDFPTEAKVFEQPTDGFIIYPLGTKEPEKLQSNE